jgi:hypothetical protein
MDSTGDISCTTKRTGEWLEENEGNNKNKDKETNA